MARANNPLDLGIEIIHRNQPSGCGSRGDRARQRWRTCSAARGVFDRRRLIGQVSTTDNISRIGHLFAHNFCKTFCTPPRSGDGDQFSTTLGFSLLGLEYPLHVLASHQFGRVAFDQFGICLISTVSRSTTCSPTFRPSLSLAEIHSAATEAGSWSPRQQSLALWAAPLAFMALPGTL